MNKITKDMTMRDNKVELTIAFPFPEIPIKDYLVNSVREAVMKLGAEVEVKLTVMNEKERQVFLRWNRRTGKVKNIWLK